MNIKYAIQCDKLRSDEAGEMVWSTLMDLAERVSQDEFESACNPDGLLDEGETLADFCADDPDHGYYVSRTPDGPVYCLQKSGFEFFFTRDGEKPSYFVSDDLVVTHLVQRHGAGAFLLLSLNDPRMNGSNGDERIIDTLPLPNKQEQGFIEVIQGREARFRFIAGSEASTLSGSAAAGIGLKDGKIEAVFTREHIEGTFDLVVAAVEDYAQRVKPRMNNLRKNKEPKANSSKHRNTNPSGSIEP